MPIYAYKCAACEHQLDVLQKISDAPLTVCPQCGAAALAKQLTAAGFQLKGSGWYVTDFRNGGGAAAKPAEGKGADAKAQESTAAASKGEAKPADAKSDAKPDAKSDAKPEAKSGGGTPVPPASS